MAQRINRFLSQAGLGSRRAVEELIQAGRVCIDGKVVVDLATRVRPDQAVEVDGRVVVATADPRVILFHKPVGVVTSFERQGRAPCLVEALGDLLDGGRLFYVGRLDRDSSGLLILTNDGDLGQQLQHPSKQVWKTYHVTVDRPLPAEGVRAIREGTVHLDQRPCAPARIRQEDETVYTLELREGRNRQIRRMVEQLGRVVMRLHRSAVGPLSLGSLAAGEWREATPRELQALRDAPQGEGD